jgi:hypothetical protein
MKCTIAACLALCFALPAACREGLEPLPLPPGARPFAPEAVYRGWWREMESCSGRTARFDDVSWYLIPGEEPFRVPKHDYLVVGYWDAAVNRIVLLEILPARRAPYIRHEMLHAILRSVFHPVEYFETRCGAVIDGPESPFGGNWARVPLDACFPAPDNSRLAAGPEAYRTANRCGS